MKAFKDSLKEITRYPSAIVGAVIILILVVIALYAVIAIPYSKAVELWRGTEQDWYLYPKYAAPEWINLFRSEKLPVSFHASSTKGGGMKKVVKPLGQGMESIDITYPFNFAADGYPQELSLYFTDTFVTKQPFVSVILITPDGRQIRIADTGVDHSQTIVFSEAQEPVAQYGGQQYVIQGFFSNPRAKTPTPLKGKYTLEIKGFTFEANSDINVQFAFYGQVSGLAGTDYERRDLMVGLLWGTPVALAFGLLASLGISLLTLVIAAIGAWYGGWVDEVIQRITELNMVLPFYPILIMIGTLINRSIVTILGCTILLSIFGGGIKAYRSVFMQVRESPYIEAARAYGASDMRIIIKYMVPRMIPTLIPALVTNVPSFVFLEASLAVLGLGDPTLPTWGKIINDADTMGALYKGYYYWILEPAALLIVTGLGFAMLGFALDRVFNPRLRGM
jgi:peptide/nickel transport system permease protein